MARKLYDGYGLTEMRRYAREYKIPGRSKMDGPALLMALREYWDSRRKEQEQALLNSVKVQPGTLLRHKSSGTVVRVASSIVTHEPYGGLYVHAEYVSLGESDAKSHPAGVDYLNRNGATHRHMLYQYEAVEPAVAEETKPRTSERDRELRAEIGHGSELANGWAFAHDLPSILADGPGGAYRWESPVYSEEETREHVRKFAHWLLRVADDAS